jgi:hypothetical protein
MKTLTENKIKVKQASVCHPQTDGIAERAIRKINSKMRVTMIKNQGMDWAFLLNTVVMAINITPSRTTGVAPFKILYLYFPQTFFNDVMLVEHKDTLYSEIRATTEKSIRQI